jgi:hypothetical protein
MPPYKLSWIRKQLVSWKKYGILIFLTLVLSRHISTYKLLYVRKQIGSGKKCGNLYSE